MSQANTSVPADTSNPTTRGVGLVFRILPAALVLLGACGLGAMSMLERSADATAGVRLAGAASTAMPRTVPTTGDTSVPDASAVFNDREAEIEEPAPTF